MKRVQKSCEPSKLIDFKNRMPNATWATLRSNKRHEGKRAYKQIKKNVLSDQGNICAYCECKLNINTPNLCRVEHFHPKSDTATIHNWALDWNNMLGVCVGGEQSGAQLPANLSCDSYKNYLIQKGILQENCDGWILNPLQIQKSCSLFSFDSNSCMITPNLSTCAQTTIIGNKYATTENLVSETIKALNLNCSRLIDDRRKVVAHVKSLKKAKREANIPPQLAMLEIAMQFFKTRWPAYFTTIRCLLGQSAEDHLQSIAYQG